MFLISSCVRKRIVFSQVWGTCGSPQSILREMPQHSVRPLCCLRPPLLPRVGVHHHSGLALLPSWLCPYVAYNTRVVSQSTFLTISVHDSYKTFRSYSYSVLNSSNVMPQRCSVLHGIGIGDQDGCQARVFCNLTRPKSQPKSATF